MSPRCRAAKFCWDLVFIKLLCVHAEVCEAKHECLKQEGKGELSIISIAVKYIFIWGYDYTKKMGIKSTQH